jgi:ABC-2 type transport system permease protein
MINLRRVWAIFIKQWKDTIKNKAVFIQFVIFPIIAMILTETIAKGNSEIPRTYFVVLFATMYAGMVPNVIMASIITEEKEQNTLRVLIMSNVKPLEYLLGVGSYTFLICSLGAVFFGLMGGYKGGELVAFAGTVIIGILASLILGSTIGILMKNQMSANSVVLPIAMVTAFLPMIAMFNKTFAKFSRFLYTQQINYLVNDLSKSNFTMERFLIIGVNIIAFLAIFLFAYRKGTFSE